MTGKEMTGFSFTKECSLRGIDRRWLIAVVVVLVLVTLMSAGCGNKKGDGPGAPEVAVVTLAYEKVPIVTELPGRISAFLIAEVRPQVTGIIKKRLFTEGSDVKAGQALYEIDPAPLPGRLRQRERVPRPGRGQPAAHPREGAKIQGTRRHQGGEPAGIR
jgi:multidrug efflux pump subunit AcrA (membrane-fusion protein)